MSRGGRAAGLAALPLLAAVTATACTRADLSSCRRGRLERVGDRRYCVYHAASAPRSSDGHFLCPDDLPVAVVLVDGVVCTDRADEVASLPPVVCRDLDPRCPTGEADAAAPDAAAADDGDTADAGRREDDAGTPDAEPLDARAPDDAGAPDATPPDARVPDGAGGDASPEDAGADAGGVAACTCTLGAETPLPFPFGEARNAIWAGERVASGDRATLHLYRPDGGGLSDRISVGPYASDIAWSGSVLATLYNSGTATYLNAFDASFTLLGGGDVRSVLGSGGYMALAATSTSSFVVAVTTAAAPDGLAVARIDEMLSVGPLVSAGAMRAPYRMPRLAALGTTTPPEAVGLLALGADDTLVLADLDPTTLGTRSDAIVLAGVVELSGVARFGGRAAVAASFVPAGASAADLAVLLLDARAGGTIGVEVVEPPTRLARTRPAVAYYDGRLVAVWVGHGVRLPARVDGVFAGCVDPAGLWPGAAPAETMLMPLSAAESPGLALVATPAGLVLLRELDSSTTALQSLACGP